MLAVKEMLNANADVPNLHPIIPQIVQNRKISSFASWSGSKGVQDSNEGVRKSCKGAAKEHQEARGSSE